MGRGRGLFIKFGSGGSNPHRSTFRKTLGSLPPFGGFGSYESTSALLDARGIVSIQELDFDGPATGDSTETFGRGDEPLIAPLVP